MARFSRRIAITATIGSVALVLLGGYTATVAAAPLPAPVVSIDDEILTPLHLGTEQAEAIIAAQPLPTAIGFAEQEAVWANDDEPRSLASISKLITVLVTLETQPLDPDTSTWPTHTWTHADQARQRQFTADGGVAFPLRVGTKIPLVDLFTLIFLPSANDMVAAYAYSVFPDNDAFLNAVDEWADRHHITSLEFVEPSGMDPANKATVTDVLNIGRMALEHPVVTQFTSIASATVPGVGFVENTNPLLGVEPDIVGLKTGRTLWAGFNFLVAQERELDTRSYTQLAVTLGRGSAEARAESGREMLAHLDALPGTLTAMEPGAHLGTVTDWSGEEMVLVAKEGATVHLLPGEQVLRTVSVDLPEHVEAGSTVGTLTVTSPTGLQEIDVIAQRAMNQPDLMWRFANPGILFQSQGTVIHEGDL